MLKVLLDVNILGRGFSAKASRTGIFRASEGLIDGLLARTDLTLFFSAEASWVSELQLLSYIRNRRPLLQDFVVRAWEQPAGTEAEGAALIDRILAREEAGGDARRDRAELTLLNATARRRPLPGAFDVVHSLRTALPPSANVPARARVLTVHDLIPLLHPEWAYEGEAQLREILASVDLERDYLIVNSESTASSVREFPGVAADRVVVTPFAADARTFYPEKDPATIARTRAKWGIPEGEYILSLCTLEPRKNLPHLVKSFFRLLERGGFEAINLVLVGPIGWRTEATFAAIQSKPGLRDRIILTGFVEDQDLAAIYSGASVFAYPSLYEGFGLPVLEAMQCGTPVVTSDTTSLPEVAGEAALCISPTDPDALCEAMRSLLGDAGRRAELSRLGLARAAEFSWEQTAALTVGAYRRMLAHSP